MVLHGIALLALARGLYLARHLSTLDMSLLFSTTIENEKKINFKKGKLLASLSKSDRVTPKKTLILKCIYRLSREICLVCPEKLVCAFLVKSQYLCAFHGKDLWVAEDYVS